MKQMEFQILVLYNNLVLQIGILRYFKLMAKDSPAVQDEISDTLAQVLTSG